ncbi:MAG: phosphoenolpyruvate carboxykinase [Phycisphaerae bacterium]|nr:phosphoenolpyruvate carboxykinase [Phycisphaerae bacterium]
MRFEREGQQLVLHTEGSICTTTRDLLQSKTLERVVAEYCELLHRESSPVIGPFRELYETGKTWSGVINLLRTLAVNPLDEVAKILPGSYVFLDAENRKLLHRFVEGLYDHWRSFNRFMILHHEPGPSSLDHRPYRSFNITLQDLVHLIRATYRDMCENITGDHPRVYRQVPAGCNVGLLAVPRECGLPHAYSDVLGRIPFIRQVWFTPPMLIDPPMNTRTGQFERVDRSPLEGLDLDKDRWLCYPAQVGPLVVFVYFHQRFIGLGCSLANLFEMATNEQIARGPDAIYLYGAPPESMSRYGELPTVFHDDEENGLLVGAVPGEDRFGYFGYLKKMILTLHNIVMMKRGRMPFHGAMVRIAMDQVSANVLIIGDTATGKSESLEALRLLGKGRLSELRVIADDMGSLEIGRDGRVLGYGTEIGAFIRLDDLQQGYAFQQLDRAIIMSPQKVNARVVLPVTTLDEVLRGYAIDFLLYANNYEQVDADHPALERFESAEEALDVFREGAAMAKGTTTATGLVHSYFANIFGPPQYREAHEALGVRTFGAAFKRGVYVGQLRTRLGIPGYEATGPHEAAKALLAMIAEIKVDCTCR